MNSELSLKTRRQFLKSTVLGAAVTWTIPSFLSRTFAALQANAADSATQVPTGKDAPILVVLQMAGGNDGLNTVIPYANDFYFKARPSLRIPAKEVLKLTDDFGLHPALEPFKALYEDGQLTIIHGAGYPNPNRSHFRSTEIWQTASDARKVEKYGWLGRYFDNACKGCDPTVGISIGRQMPQAFASAKPIGICLDNPQNYRFATDDVKNGSEMKSSERFFRELNGSAAIESEALEASAGASITSLTGAIPAQLSPLDYLERTALDAQISSDRILAASRKSRNQASYPPSQLANSLKLVARLIGGGLATRVYYISQGGYDTHANQAPAQDRLLRDLASAVKAFGDDLKAQRNADRVLVMTFSEFGRRVAQNANGGTDHGAAAPMFMVAPKVKAGFLGSFPSIAPADLHNGDLKFTTDFRSVYAGVLETWLQTSSAPVLGRKFPLITCV